MADLLVIALLSHEQVKEVIEVVDEQQEEETKLTMMVSRSRMNAFM